LKAKKKNPRKGRYFVPTTPVIKVNRRHQERAGGAAEPPA